MTDLMNTLTTPMTYVEMALLLFFSVFISVLVRESMRTRQEVNHLGSLPLQDDKSEATDGSLP